MNMKLIFAPLFVLGLFALMACTPPADPQIAFSDAWVRVPPGGRDITGAYMTIENTGGPDKLLSASATGIARVEVHTHEEIDGMMSMRELEFLEIPAGAKITFAPGGLHLMVFDAAGLKEGDEIHFLLNFERAGEQSFTGVVGNRKAMPMKH